MYIYTHLYNLRQIEHDRCFYAGILIIIIYNFFRVCSLA